MNERLRNHIDGLFASASRTKKITELKEELFANLMEKYNDLIAKGYEEEAAYNTVIEGIGDVDELIRGLKEPDVFNYAQMQQDRQKSALVVSVCVGLYILSIIMAAALTTLFPGYDLVAGLAFLSICAVSTCILIYHFMSRPKYIKADDTMVEEFKEWKSANAHDKSIQNSISSIIWTLTVAVYLMVSFAFGIWAWSWIIFIIAVAVQNIARLLYDLCADNGKPAEFVPTSASDKELMKSISAVLWPLIVVFYFGLSFTFGAWAYSWIIFIIGAVIQSVIKLLFDIKRR